MTRGHTPTASAFIACAVFAGLAFVGCGHGCRDDDELPVVRCSPVPAGSRGCVGLPREVVSSSSATYPVGCSVISSTPAPRNTACDYTVFDCIPDPGGNGTYRWIIPL